MILSHRSTISNNSFSSDMRDTYASIASAHTSGSNNMTSSEHAGSRHSRPTINFCVVHTSSEHAFRIADPYDSGKWSSGSAIANRRTVSAFRSVRNTSNTWRSQNSTM